MNIINSGLFYLIFTASVWVAHCNSLACLLASAPHQALAAPRKVRGKAHWHETPASSDPPFKSGSWTQKNLFIIDQRKPGYHVAEAPAKKLVAQAATLGKIVGSAEQRRSKNAKLPGPPPPQVPGGAPEVRAARRVTCPRNSWPRMGWKRTLCETNLQEVLPISKLKQLLVRCLMAILSWK